ncbi:Hypothetical protein AA314_06090 [Archangium gephyra]|uniref:Uncharacterized protein n=1 Tax=Archangium gephyra TaxID=48 RepID=A0AAC8QBL7_9BACT|nr:Hypothetical protein AA314_06090 [Archangium gephyra]
MGKVLSASAVQRAPADTRGCPCTPQAGQVASGWAAALRQTRSPSNTPRQTGPWGNPPWRPSPLQRATRRHIPAPCQPEKATGIALPVWQNVGHTALHPGLPGLLVGRCCVPSPERMPPPEGGAQLPSP